LTSAAACLLCATLNDTSRLPLKGDLQTVIDQQDLFNDPEEFLRVSAELRDAPPQDVLAWGIATFGRGLAIVTSFQVDGMAILDMATKIDPHVRVVTIDSGRLFPETYDVMDHVRERYGVPVEVYYPNSTELEAFVLREGINPFYRNVGLRKQCCEIRKVEPIRKVLGSLDAWVTGLRRDQAWTRSDIGAIELDKRYYRVMKLNPLATWTEEQVWRYVREHNVPYNRLYDRGYTSIGCAPCTRVVEPGEDPRAGRWWWELDAVKECGIHRPLE
jgi:phosphoadenosine phosphosulfate reductase